MIYLAILIIITQSYADDDVVSVLGKSTEVLSDRMQTDCQLIHG